MPQVVDQRVSADDFLREQKKDESLRKCFYSAEATKWKPMSDQTTHFVVDRGLIYRLYMKDKGGEIVKQLVVPRILRRQIMRLWHETLLLGHRGVWKSPDRILLNFYWPGIAGDVHTFCQSCDICQRSISRGNVPKAPVQICEHTLWESSGRFGRTHKPSDWDRKPIDLDHSTLCY